MAIEGEILGLEVIVEGLKKFQSDMDKADKSVGKNATRWSKLGKFAKGAGKILKGVAIKGIAAAGAAAVTAGAGIGALAAVIGKLAIEAAPIEGVKNAFEGLTESFEGGSSAMLLALKDSSAGMIANRDLMMSFNKAAQLVSKDFAEQLPDAMQYLSKVAAATGEEMGYMMDSLVRGVGRLSPMILDNLGIQVDMVEANEAWAASNGVLVASMTKEEQQAALMAQVMEKLAENTAAMPDVTGTAATKMAELKATFQDTKDAIGIAFLPVLSELLGVIGDLATNVGPKLIEWAEKAGDFLGNILPDAIEGVKSLLKGDFEKAFWDIVTAISKAFGRETALKVIGWKNKVEAFVDKAVDVFQKISDWVQEHWPPIQAVILGVVEKIKTWFETNWPIIQAVVLTAWEVIQSIIRSAVAVIVPVVQEFVGNIRENLESFTPVFDALKSLWESLKPVISVVLAAIGAIVLAAVGILIGLWKGLMAALGPIIKGIAGVLEGVIKAVQGIVDFIVGAVELIISLFQKNEEGTTAAWEKMKEGLTEIIDGLWKAVKSLFVGAFDAIMELIGGFVSGVVDFFTNLYEDLVGGSIIPDMLTSMWEAFKEGLAKIIQGIVDWIADVIEKIKSFVSDFIQVGKDLIAGMAKGIREAVKDLLRKVGDWIQDIIEEAKKRAGLASPSEVFREIGHNMMEGLALGIEEMLPKVNAQVQMAMTAPASTSGGSSTHNTYNNYNLSTTSTTSSGTLAMEFADMAMATR